MRLIKVTIGVCLVSLSFFYILYSKSFSTQDPGHVVEYYCEISRKGEFNDIKQITTSPPDEYWKSKLRDYEIIKNSDSKALGGELFEETTGFTPNENPSENSDMMDSIYLELVNDKYPKLLQRNDVYIEQIKQVWINGEKAKVRVTLQSFSLSKYISQKDFFLYLIDDDWKIFKVATSTTNTYATP